MNLFGLFRRSGSAPVARGSSAPVARDRLQVLLSYERSSTNRGASDLLFILRDEILTTVGRHVEIDPERVTVQMDRGEKVSVLEVDIEIPNNIRPVPTTSRKKRIAGPAHRPA